MYRMQKNTKAIKKDLKNIHIESEHEGIALTLNGELEIVNINIGDEALEVGVKNKKILEDRIKKAFEKALKKTQQIAAEKMKGVMGDLNMFQ